MPTDLVGKLVEVLPCGDAPRWRGRVESLPADVGDCWRITDMLGRLHCVQQFEEIVEVRDDD